MNKTKPLHQHWVHHLPEVGTLTSQAYKQEFRLRHLKELKAEVKALMAEINAEEINLTNTALHNDWTQQEIDQAKQQARDFPTVEASREHAYQQATRFTIDA